MICGPRRRRARPGQMLLLVVIVSLASSRSATPRAMDAPPPAAITPTRPVATTDLVEGARLFVAYNCGDCHGAGGSGAMGPSLQDNRWRFGGSPSDIARSITDGRPEGMPAWKPWIPTAQVQQLVAYIESLGKGKDLTTENFTGTTVERTGH